MTFRIRTRPALNGWELGCLRTMRPGAAARGRRESDT